MGIPSAFAQKVLRSLDIRNSDDLKRLDLIAWRLGALILEKPLGGAEARLITSGQRAIIVVSEATQDIRRKRFSIAHELGHLEMHKSSKHIVICDKKDISYLEQSRIDEQEKEANEFASSLLLPSDLISELIESSEPSIDSISLISEQFDVSLTATALRYINLSIEPLAFACSKSQIIKWYVCNKQMKDLGLYANAPARLDGDTYAADFFKESGPTKRSGHVPLHSWFPNCRYSEESQIMEDSYYMANYNTVVTLLWPDKVI